MKDPAAAIQARHPISPGVRAANPQLFGRQPAPAAAEGNKAPLEIGNTKIKGTKQPNATEQRMLDICAARKRRGEIDSYRYEGLTLKWGRDPKTGAPMRYTPDVVVCCGAEWTMIEVKGAKIWDRDLVRFKGCRAEWPEYHFEMWQWAKGEWTRVQ